MTYTVKDIRISTDILLQVFLILTKPVPYKFVSVNRRNDEAQAHIAVCASGFIIPSIQTYTEVTEPVSLKYGKLATKYPRIYGYLLQCSRLEHSSARPVS